MLALLGVFLALWINYPKINIPKECKTFSWNSIIEVKSIIPSLNALILLVCYGSIISFITIYGKEIGVEHPGVFFLPFGIGILLARILGGKIFDSKGPLIIVPVGIFLIIAGFPILAFIQNEWGVLFVSTDYWYRNRGNFSHNTGYGKQPGWQTQAWRRQLHPVHRSGSWNWYRHAYYRILGRCYRPTEHLPGLLCYKHTRTFILLSGLLSVLSKKF